MSRNSFGEKKIQCFFSLIPNSVLYSMGKHVHLGMENEESEAGNVRNQVYKDM